METSSSEPVDSLTWALSLLAWEAVVVDVGASLATLLNCSWRSYNGKSGTGRFGKIANGVM